jgi:hypothetical protein
MNLPTPSVASLAIVHSTGVGSFTGMVMIMVMIPAPWTLAEKPLVAWL